MCADRPKAAAGASGWVRVSFHAHARGAKSQFAHLKIMERLRDMPSGGSTIAFLAAREGLRVEAGLSRLKPRS